MAIELLRNNIRYAGPSFTIQWTRNSESRRNVLCVAPQRIERMFSWSRTPPLCGVVDYNGSDVNGQRSVIRGQRGQRLKVSGSDVSSAGRVSYDHGHNGHSGQREDRSVVKGQKSRVRDHGLVTTRQTRPTSNDPRLTTGHWKACRERTNTLDRTIRAETLDQQTTDQFTPPDPTRPKPSCRVASGGVN